MPRHMPRVAIAICVVAIALAPSVANGQTTPAKPARCIIGQFVDGCQKLDGTIWHPGVADTIKSGGNPFDNLTDELLKKILADVTYAKALAKASNNEVTLPCWTAWVELTSAQTAPVKDDAGNELALPEPHFFVLAERASEFIRQLQPDSKLSIACAPTLQASKRDVGNLIGAVVSGGALGLFKLPGL